jgi:putative transposase
VGLKVLLITAGGDGVETPRHYRQAERYLAKCPRRLAQRKQGGHRRPNAVDILAKPTRSNMCAGSAATLTPRRRSPASARTTRSRSSYLEAMQAAHLIRRRAPKPDGNGGYEHNGARRQAGLNKRLQDAGWSQVLSSLTFQAASAGKRVDAVSPASTTQECSNLMRDGTVWSAATAAPSRSRSVPTYARAAGMWRIATRMRRGTFKGAGSERLRGLVGMPAGVNREPAGL